MAKKDKNIGTGMRKSVRNTLSRMKELLDDIYNDTYSSSKMNDTDLEDITDTLSNSIDNIISNSFGDSNISSMSKMVNRFENNSADINSTLKEALDVMESGSVAATMYGLYSQNLWIKDYDYEIDAIIKYMPRLKEALDVLKDCILSADHFSKEYLILKSNITDDTMNVFSRRSNDIKKKYKLQEFIENCYDDISKYGETFVYIVPYKREIAKLLNNKASHNIGSNPNINNLAGLMTESFCITESTIRNEKIIEDTKNFSEGFNLQVTISSGYIESLYEKTTAVCEAMENITYRPFTEQFSDIIAESKSENIKLYGKELEVPYDITEPYKTATADGLIDTSKEVKENQLKVPGCIVKKLPRDKLIIARIEEMVLGYYYVEVIGGQVDIASNKYMSSSTMSYMGATNTSTTQREKDIRDQNIQNNVDKILSYTSAKIAQSIDAKFVNSNQDIVKDIYMILKHNDTFNDPVQLAKSHIKVTFIPSDDIIHMYFKMNQITGRGISDLDLSIFPAKLYISLYINDTLNNLIRGQDKRVYYVKQNVETNISATLMNTLNQIKKGNFGIRQVENLSSMLNIIGRFNDYLIPVNSQSDPPIQFEVMPGMKSDLDNEQMERLEKMAINPTDVAMEILETRNSMDFAIQATMVNSKLMRKSYKRQAIFQDFCSALITKIYNYEYDDNININVQLPAPAFLNISNSSNLLATADSYVQSIVDMRMKDKDEDVVNEFKKLAMEYYIGTQIDMTVLDNLEKRAALIVAARRSNNNSEE